jgi:CRP-like cAMP-binding protein
MDILELFKNIHEFSVLDGQDRSELAKRCRERTLRRKQYLLQEGDICDHLTFVVKGCFKMYAVDDAGKEHIIHFSQENDWLADLGSFYSQEPGKVFIEAMEPSRVIRLSREDVYYLYERSLNFNRLIRVMVENRFIELQKRVLQNISSSAEERYLGFLKQYPALSQRIPNTAIASYLGITPEFLSTIRKKLSSARKQS